jgi:hypothetical protein
VILLLSSGIADTLNLYYGTFLEMPFVVFFPSFICANSFFLPQQLLSLRAGGYRLCHL